MANQVIQSPTPRDKSVAIILAIAFGPGAWAYTYRVDRLKFWIGVLVGGLGLLLCGIPTLAVWVWAIADSVRRPDSFYKTYPGPDVTVFQGGESSPAAPDISGKKLGMHERLGDVLHMVSRFRKEKLWGGNDNPVSYLYGVAQWREASKGRMWLGETPIGRAMDMVHNLRNPSDIGGFYFKPHQSPVFLANSGKTVTAYLAALDQFLSAPLSQCTIKAFSGEWVEMSLGVQPFYVFAIENADDIRSFVESVEGQRPGNAPVPS